MNDDPQPSERILHSPSSGRAAQLSVLVPFFRADPTPLLERFATCARSTEVEFVFFDDGTGDPKLTVKLEQVLEETPLSVRVAVSAVNGGRAAARNRLGALASTDWLLFFDSDMWPDDEAFFSRYLDAISSGRDVAMVVGGYSAHHTRRGRNTGLHYAQTVQSESIEAAERRLAPGRFVFTGNVLVRRDVFDAVTFDQGFQGWGWEDTDWGLRVAERYAIDHIDNPASHLGLATDSEIVAKYGGSGANFARALQRHPAALGTTPLAKNAKRIAGLPEPVRAIIVWVSKRAALAAGLLPDGVRLKALKLFRAASYARAL